MPIRPYLADQAFDPETIAKMSAALKNVCEALSLKMIDDAATRFVAEKPSAGYAMWLRCKP